MGETATGGGPGGREITPGARASGDDGGVMADGAAWVGTLITTGLSTSFSMVRTCRESSNRVAIAIPAISNWTNAIKPSTQQAIGKTGMFPELETGGFDKSMH